MKVKYLADLYSGDIEMNMLYMVESFTDNDEKILYYKIYISA